MAAARGGSAGVAEVVEEEPGDVGTGDRAGELVAAEEAGADGAVRGASVGWMNRAIVHSRSCPSRPATSQGVSRRETLAP